MDRNLYILKSRPFLPILSWAKNAGPPSLLLIKTNKIKKTGEKAIRTSRLPMIANFPGFYNSMSKKPTITAFFEV
jgi:hypothetical protein